MLTTAISGARTALLVFLLASVSARAEPFSSFGDTGRRIDDSLVIEGTVASSNLSLLPRTDLFRWDSFAPPSPQADFIPALARNMDFGGLDRASNEGFYRPTDTVARTDVFNVGRRGVDQQSGARADDFGDIYRSVSAGRGTLVGDDGDDILRPFVRAPRQIDVAYLDVLAAEQSDHKIASDVIDVLRQAHTDLADVRNSVLDISISMFDSHSNMLEDHLIGPTSDAAYSRPEASYSHTYSSHNGDDDHNILRQLESAIAFVREYFWAILTFALVLLVLQAPLHRK